MSSYTTKPIRLNKNPIRKYLGMVINALFSCIDRRFPKRLAIEEQVEVNEMEIPILHLSPRFDGYRIAHISDIHLGTWIKPFMLEGIAAMVNSLQAQLVVISGDLVSSSTISFLPEYEQLFKRLYAPDGVVVVRGNHDCYAKKAEFIRIVENCGAIYLENQLYQVRRGDAVLTIAGLDSWYYLQEDLAAVMQKISAQSAAILVVHEPDYADISARSGLFSLQLSGHSHGGQIQFPFIGSPWLPHAGRKYPRGLYQVHGMMLYTNSGLGTSSAHFRLGCPAEIALIKLLI